MIHHLCSRVAAHETEREREQKCTTIAVALQARKKKKRKVIALLFVDLKSVSFVFFIRFFFVSLCFLAYFPFLISTCFLGNPTE